MEKYRLPSGHGGWEYCPVTRVEIEKKMSDKKVAVSTLVGLLHDLKDHELFELTDSNNRRALKEFLTLCRYKHCFWLRYDEPLDDMFQKEGLVPETKFSGQKKLLLVDRRQIKLATDFKPRDEVPVKGEAVLNNLRAFKNRRLLDAYCLQKLFRHQELIPNEWKTKSGIYFWGTIFTDRDGRRFVAFLKWESNRWDWGACYLEHYWFGYEQVAYIEEKNDECS